MKIIFDRDTSELIKDILEKKNKTALKISIASVG